MRPVSASPRSSTIDFSVVARLQTLGRNHHFDLLGDAVESFARQAPALVEGLRAAVEADCALHLRYSAGQLASRAQALGARQIAGLCEALRLMSLGGSLGDCLPVIDRLGRACRDVSLELAEARALLGQAPRRRSVRAAEPPARPLEAVAT